MSALESKVVEKENLKVIQFEEYVEVEPDSNEGWHWIDLDDFESKVRENERMRIKRKAIINRQKRAAKRNRQIKELKYFIMQKSIGLALIVSMILGLKYNFFWDYEIQANDGTAAILFILMGLALVFSKQKMIVNSYYFECEEREKKKQKRNK